VKKNRIHSVGELQITWFYCAASLEILQDVHLLDSLPDAYLKKCLEPLPPLSLDGDD